MPADDATSRATAVFSDTFQFPGLEADPRTPDMIERDRVIMAARPGMLRKLLPLRVDERGAARRARLSSVWLLYCPDEHHPQIGLVTVASHDGHTPTGVAKDDLTRLESLPSLGAALAEELGATKVFDRTSWIHQVWFPLPAAGADYESSSPWPNSPPLPAPVQR